MDMREILEEAGYETRQYSGRGMYGNECVAVATDDSSAAVVASASKIVLEYVVYRDTLMSEAIDMLRRLANAREDSLGLGIVIYWPREAFHNEERENEED